MMYTYETFVRLAKESNTNEELVAKIKASGGNAMIRGNEVYSGAKDYFGYVTFSAELTSNGFKTIMY